MSHADLEEIKLPGVVDETPPPSPEVIAVKSGHQRTMTPMMATGSSRRRTGSTQLFNKLKPVAKQSPPRSPKVAPSASPPSAGDASPTAAAGTGTGAGAATGPATAAGAFLGTAMLDVTSAASDAAAASKPTSGSVFDVVKSAMGGKIMGSRRKKKSLMSFEELADMEDDGEAVDLATAAIVRPPSCRTRVQRYFQTSSASNRMDFLNAFLSVLSFFFYVAETYTSDKDKLQVFADIELAMSIIFTIDYILRCYLVTPMTRFIFSWAAMLDVITVLPVFATYTQEQSSEVSLMSFLRVLRILRILRVHRAFRYVESEVIQSMLRLLLVVVTLVCVCAGLFQIIENLYDVNEPDYRFHDALYFVIVTVTTVGYGDISPKSEQGRVFVIVLICVSFLLVPLEANKFLRQVEASSQFKLVDAPSKKGKVQVMVCGHVQSAAIGNFFAELLHEDHSNPVHHIVVLDPDEPSIYMMEILESTLFANRITYVQGSPRVQKDLRRARVATAAGVFILADQFSSDTDKDDSASMLTALSIKRFVSVMMDRDVPMYLQLIKLESKEHFLGSLPLGMTATIVCVQQLKMNMLATSFVCPAVVPMIHNLVVSDDSEPEPTDPAWLKQYMDGRGYEIYRTHLSDAFAGLTFLEAVGIIYEETSTVMFGLEVFDRGTGHSKIFVNPGFLTIPEPEQFKTMGFVIAKDETTADLVGLQDGFGTDLTVAAQNAFVRLTRRLRRTPGADSRKSMIPSINEGDVDPLAKAAAGAGAGESKQTAGSRLAGMASLVTPSAVRVTASTPDAKASADRKGSAGSKSFTGSSAGGGGAGGGAGAGPLHVSTQRLAESSAPGITLVSTPTGRGSPSKQPNVVRVKLSASTTAAAASGANAEPKRTRASRLSCAGLETLVDNPSMRRGPSRSAIAVMKRRYYLRNNPSTLEECTIVRGAHNLKGHVIVVGHFVNLFHFVQPLRSRQLPDPRPIIFLGVDPMTQTEWESISHFAQVYYMEGTPLSKPHLLEAGIKTAAFVVCLSRQHSSGTVEDLTSFDSEALFYTQSIYRSQPSVNVVCELADYNNTNFLKPELADFTEQADQRGYQLSQHFASGTVYTSSILDILLCQAFFNPSIVMLLEQLIVGGDSVGMGRTRIRHRGNGVSQVLRGTGDFQEGLNLDQLSSSDEDRDDPERVKRKAAARAMLKDKPNEVSADQGYVNKTVEKAYQLERLAADAQNSRILQWDVPKEFIGKSYERLFLFLTKWRASVPLGLYVSRNEAKGNTYPFVFTNPRKTHKLCAGDRVFVLAPITLQKAE